MSEATKKLLNLFRSRSTSDRERERPHGRRYDRQRSSSSPSRRRTPHSHSSLTRTESQVSDSGHASEQSGPTPIALTQWPPLGLAAEESLSQGKAMELIASGVPVFRGFRRPVPHAAEDYYTLYATCGGTGHVGDDRAGPRYAALEAASFRIGGPGIARYPWDTLENPSMSFCYGARPGTVTLNHWVALSERANPAIELRDPGVRPRDIELSTILQRLIYLQGGFEEDYEDLMYKNLYKILLRDPDRFTSPHKAMEKQIADLILVLSRPEWIDFSRPGNQIVAKFFADATYVDRGRYKVFFHQLLLATELSIRIHSKQHAESPKEKLLAQLPPRIAWDLALARKWSECMNIEGFNADNDPQQSEFIAEP